MQRQRVLTWIMSATLAAVAGPVWAQPSLDEAKENVPGTTGDEAGDAVTFEGSDVMQSGELEEDEAGNASPADRPWAEGVSAENQAKAQILFKEGNELLRESLFPQAVRKYREALELWDHPGIHDKLSLALLDLEQPIAIRPSASRTSR